MYRHVQLTVELEMLHEGIGLKLIHTINYSHCTLLRSTRIYTCRCSLYSQLLVRGECACVSEMLDCYTVLASELEEAVGFSKVFRLLVDGKKVS